MYHKSENYVNEAWGFNITIVDNDCDIDCDTHPYAMHVESVYLYDGSVDDMALSDCYETLEDAFKALGDTITEAYNMLITKED